MQFSVKPARSLLFRISFCLIAHSAAINAYAGDSTTVTTNPSIPIRSQTSILGSVSDGLFCKYVASDRKIHCTTGMNGSEPTEFLASGALHPQFRGPRNNTEGRIAVNNGDRYAFLNAETEQLLGDGSSSLHCRLALQFKLMNGDLFWIWHTEIRFEGSQTAAYVDSDGDGHADFAVLGEWTGRINGTNRWSVTDPNDRTYTDAQLAYPTRPFFGRTGTRRRNCRMIDLTVVSLVDAATIIQTRIVGSKRNVLGVVSN